MWQYSKLEMQSTGKCLLNPQPSPLPPNQHTQTIPTTTSPSPPSTLKLSPKISRRELAIRTKSSILLLLGSQAHQQFHWSKAIAEENPPLIGTNDGQEVDTSNKAMQEGNTPTIDTLNDAQQVDHSSKEAITEENSLDTNDAQADNASQIDAGEKPTTTETNDAQQVVSSDDTSTNTDDCTTKRITKRAFFEVSVNGEPIGRIVVGLHGSSAPFATSRFSSIISGAAGITYRRKEFVKIMPTYVQHGGVRSFGVDADLAKKTGNGLAADTLVSELDKANESCPGTKNVAGSVGIIVRDPFKPPPKVKLVARKGKLEVDEEEVGKDPNGSEFVICAKDSPELDASTLVVGRVLEGMDVVEKIEQVKTVQENTASPYFRVAKLIGDKRAVVAERGFNRPYAKVIVTNCGLLH